MIVNIGNRTRIKGQGIMFDFNNAIETPCSTAFPKI